MHSPSSNSANDLLGVLNDYFGEAIARLFLTITLQRFSLNLENVPATAVPDVVRGLIEKLPSYLGDAKRREQCITRLVALVPEGSLRSSVPSPQPVSPTSRQTRPFSASPEPIAEPLVVLPVNSAEDIIAVCDRVRALARRVGFAQLLQTKIATAAAELARNVQLYAGRGEVRLSTIGDPPRGIEVVTLDNGPGIPNLDVVLGGTYRSRTGMGMGLRGARKLMDTFDISTSPSGTRVVVRKYLA